MKRLVVGVIATLSLFIAMNGIALAKDVCLLDSFGETFVFRKVGNLKKGGAIPLAGFVLSTSAAPVQGTATMNAAGTEARFGIFIHSMMDQGGNNFTAEWIGDKTFAGRGFFDNEGTFKVTGEIELAVIDCKTVAIP